MNQETFTRNHGGEWTQLSAELLQESTPLGDDFPQLYRRLAQQLSLARSRGYSQALVAQLNTLALLGYRHLYPARPDRWRAAAHQFFLSFPAAVRAEWRFVLLSALLFYVPYFGTQVAVHLHPPVVHMVMDPWAVATLEESYDPASAHFLKERASDSDFQMFGFYIYNNISIALRTFASGALFGVGSLVTVLSNAVLLGAAAGHIDVIGYQETFYPFVIGHGAFELNAIVLAGSAGLRLGWSVVAPGALTRRASLRAMAARQLPMVTGFVGMLVIAAFLEAFWSSSVTIPAAVRLGVGAGLWLTVGLWLGLAGRVRAPR